MEGITSAGGCGICERKRRGEQQLSAVNSRQTSLIDARDLSPSCLKVMATSVLD